MTHRDLGFFCRETLWLACTHEGVDGQLRPSSDQSLECAHGIVSPSSLHFFSSRLVAPRILQARKFHLLTIYRGAEVRGGPFVSCIQSNTKGHACRSS
jgi:hypothetical protein